MTNLCTAGLFNYSNASPCIIIGFLWKTFTCKVKWNLFYVDVMERAVYDFPTDMQQGQRRFEMRENRNTESYSLTLHQSSRMCTNPLQFHNIVTSG